MWCNRDTYDNLWDALVAAQSEGRALIQVNAQLNAHIEWMRVRLTQLEYERAQLLRKYMGLDIPTPSFDAPDEHPDPNQVIGFGDVGDKVAETLGITWREDGTLNYEK